MHRASRVTQKWRVVRFPSEMRVDSAQGEKRIQGIRLSQQSASGDTLV